MMMICRGTPRGCPYPSRVPLILTENQKWFSGGCMGFNPAIHHRRSIRIPLFNYSSSGRYFITVCVQERECLLGSIKNGIVSFSDIGHIVKEVWDELPQRFPRIRLDECIVMPNHFHGIIWIDGIGAPLVGAPPVDAIAIRAGTRPAPTGFHSTLGDVIGAFKSITTVRYITLRQKFFVSVRTKLWQRNYWEHIIRNEVDLDRIRTYIIQNPIEWEADGENPDRCKKRIFIA